MEEDPGRLKRRYTVPSSVLIPAKFEFMPMTKPPKSTSVHNGHQHHCLPSSSPPSFSSPSVDTDFGQLVSFSSSPMYTSLKDLLPSSPNSLLSPTPAACAVSSAASATTTSSVGVSSLSGYEISIRNRLVKQAAWAYLQPMASSPSASGFRLWSYFSRDFLRQFLSSVKHAVVGWTARAFNYLADALWLILCR